MASVIIETLLGKKYIKRKKAENISIDINASAK